MLVAHLVYGIEAPKVELVRRLVLGVLAVFLLGAEGVAIHN